MRAAAALLTLLTLTGCAAAAIPLVAGVGIAATNKRPPKPNQAEPAVSPNTLALAEPAVVDPAMPAQFSALIDHVRSRATLWREGAPINSLVLDSRQTVLNPVAIDCQRREPVVIIDLDQNGKDPLPAYRNDVIAAPGWPNTLVAIRAEKVGILWVTDQISADADAIRALLARTGLDATGTDSIATRDSPEDRKQAIRQRLASQYCILAVVGDTRSDADEAYAYLRSPETPLPIDSNWGEGWFLLPPPLVATLDLTKQVD
ncbi:MAG: hypothetical protein HC788_08980 [Sphingopyxis sp.]|nr:hypothetical protein [Sphingopyxis sp.]